MQPEDWTTAMVPVTQEIKETKGPPPATSKPHRLWSGVPKLDGLYLRPSATTPVSNSENKAQSRIMEAPLRSRHDAERSLSHVLVSLRKQTRVAPVRHRHKAATCPGVIQERLRLDRPAEARTG